MDEIVLDIFDVIGEDFFGGGVTARSVSQLLAVNEDAKSVRVRVNSPGGDVFEGHAIVNLLRASGKKVKVEIHGLAASMAATIASAGDEVVMADTAMFMIHNPWAITVGDADVMRDTGEMLDKVKGTLVSGFVKKTGKTKTQVSKLMDAETWMNAKEAKSEGFVDKVTDRFDSAPDTSAEAEGRIFATLKKFERAPQRLLAQFSNAHGLELVAASSKKGAERQEQPKPKATTMDRAQLLALFGLSENATDEEIQAKAKTLQTPVEAASTVADMVPRADYDLLNEKHATLKAEKEADEKKRFEADCKTAVDNACAAGKITPGTKEYHLKSCLRGQEALDDFKAFAEAATEMVSDDQTKGKKEDPEGRTGALTAEEKIVCKKMGITEEEFRATQKNIRENPEVYPPSAYSA